MYKTATKHKRHAEHDLYTDLEKIKSALGDTARDVKGKATDMLSQSYENAKEKTADLQDGLIDYVQDKPLKAVGIAVLTGFILGRLFFRKK